MIFLERTHTIKAIKNECKRNSEKIEIKRLRVSAAMEMNERKIES